ncbi:MULTISPECIES: 23S rRNA (guanosine(2251)-2'-O)-methyltransferase RlmB [unclassified Saccharopolyspora]|uniref:23S rRNA (guanosine(2251)-2'-O)-methyltransferase RlmB n=1 Tax=unclassified Saccharopolyspora TaxID=2646250 RepID=UPI001CD4B982|nr:MULTISPECIES: 23S rRNA (guanosine(2251)-2'-O)-methyltransferase RlmB [unclassified Saccharopolyspora]MCA1188636.1 23S rRNA (guanosine(2251)-2'-O)-methyltransferase RlmB [Saccharopolyspora sp. 6T]MCA1193159.1 23S rRNA (guanosine(2251)-2'-O)-methyltransferase RlmB [Saccharopolyspora sp. 6V]MCA1227866.1 23S rRNA (guanosine(2251)-2'-O)-methyltransferase RlmB [Saccharopolyspora sp. 6M]MCA1281988.1 23S rRNA (guanosine(2251)-2'-O)-methyltransferase RlmB [Saccharopolyspora sp. 7B]
MAGNDKRRGATRKPGTKKGMVKGSGGQRRKGLEGKGPTPKAKDRVPHPAKKRADAAKARTEQQNRRQREQRELPEMVAGRNPVAECLRAGVPATGLYVAQGIDTDDRVKDAVRNASDRGISVIDVPRTELDRMTGGAMHQGLVLQVPPFKYAHPDDVLAHAADSGRPPLLVALDGVTDPRNLGAVIRSAAAFGAHGVILPQRRSAGMTAVAWRTSAGTAAQLPVAMAVNLTRTLKDLKNEGLMVVGLDADSDITSDELELAGGPLVVVVGSEGRGLSRLVRETCDQTVSIPMAGQVESLNASVAAGVVLAEVARRRRIKPVTY